MTKPEIRNTKDERRDAAKTGTACRNPLSAYPADTKAMEFYHRSADDTDGMMRDPRSREIAAQMLKAAGSICACFEEGFGRGTPAEFSHRIRLALGEARETFGWYERSRKWLAAALIEARCRELDEVIALLVATLAGINRRR